MVKMRSELAWAQQFPPPIPAGIIPERTVTIRYDGVRANGHEIIFAVLGDDDLRRLPDRLIRGLDFSVVRPDGELRGSPDAFFIGSERQLSLCVNIDAYPDFTEQVRDLALEAGFTALNGDGDLQLMKGPDGDITAPPIPAFVENGLGYVPSRLAMSYLGIEPDAHDHSGPDFG